jgi:ABC-type branched-subunit amino acid transport system ATPase component
MAARTRPTASTPAAIVAAAARVLSGGPSVGSMAGLSVLVIDKNIGPLLRIADSHFVLEKGRTVWSGSSQSLLDQKDILKETLGV